ncbi:P-loop NTPase family protein [Motilibacter aurantiacus]|uniref:hypothetical protein n=1 Tax=Motilibacter aurantiacus TaxID=2714955 RepID=UPI001409449A|nr:hypothetical protein [Motilibacter aurantiacus]NHC46945.1 hypothetical protein [Motilibacter aurantiacus]
MTRATLNPGDRIHDDEALLALATQLGRELDDFGRTLALTWLDADDHLLPIVVPIGDIPELPDEGFGPGLETVMGASVHEHAPGGSVVPVLIRGGSPTVTAGDRAWNRLLREQDSVRVRGVFVAVAGTVRPIAVDDAA